MSLGLWIRKSVECFKMELNPSRNMENSVAEGNSNCGRLTEEISTVEGFWYVTWGLFL